MSLKIPIRQFAVLTLAFAVYSFNGCSKSISDTTVTPDPTPDTTSNTTPVTSPAATAKSSYTLIWSDEFNQDGDIDPNYWSYCPRGTVAWTTYLTENPNYAHLSNGNLNLRLDNAIIDGDNAAYHSGGIKTAGKFNFTYGKIEVRAKFTQGQGSWPAIWLMPDDPASYGGWPASGEIDIMEHVKYYDYVGQTLHNSTVTKSDGGSTAGVAADYNTTDFNIYGLEWTPTTINFYVNDKLTNTYTKIAGAGSSQWPYDKPFYIILNQSGGAGMAGSITDAELPFTMDVDYVRVYKNSYLTDGDFESEQLTGWTSTGTDATLTTDNVQAGKKAILLSGENAGTEQKITGLAGNTHYRFGGFGLVSASGVTATMGAKDFGDTEVKTDLTKLNYTQGYVDFTTGVSDTTVTVYFQKSGGGTASGDDFYLEVMQ